MNETTLPELCYAVRPWRRSPEESSSSFDIYQSSPAERALVVAAAIDAGITFFHAAHEREAVSLGESIARLGIRPRVTLSVTDGDALSRCPDTEQGAFDAITHAVTRKLELLQVDALDIFHLYDFRREVHTPTRLAGAVRALEAAQFAGRLRRTGAACYGDYESLADAVTAGTFRPESVIARFNFLDRGAAQQLLPVCGAWNIRVLAAQAFGWAGGISFTQFPNTWRLRNMTKNFTGHAAGTLHLNWVLRQEFIAGAVVSMQSAAQVRENAQAVTLTGYPADVEALFPPFVEAIAGTRSGWRELLKDEQWEVRAAAEAYLSRQQK